MFELESKNPNEITIKTATKNIVIEVATFDMYAVRKTAMRHGVFTDALARFNKGQSPLQNDRVLARLMTMVQDLTGAQQASDVYDLPDKTGQLDEVSLSGSVVFMVLISFHTNYRRVLCLQRRGMNLAVSSNRCEIACRVLVRTSF